MTNLTRIGPFNIIKSLGKGGMGEVFLAFDPTCLREVALKRVRTDLATHETIKNRFLREALITSQLAHPAIVPIYSIHEEDGALYYIMPYLQGKTLKTLIREKETSISTFLRLFIMVCQAIAYAHSKGFLHRDIKPENIIVGDYGQIHILDWGLVKAIDDTSEEESVDLKVEKGLTRPGKLVGTLAFLAPERVLKYPSSISSDIYALGVIFYQMLTLRLPFRRKSLKEFKQMLHKEKLVDPIEAAPYRDVPPELSRIVKKCLAFKPSERYKTVGDLIKDLENYLEGRSDWFFAKELHIAAKEDWQFQEHVMLREAKWVSVMVSKEAFFGNTLLSCTLKIASKGEGIGFLLSVPPQEERRHPTDGYSLWLSALPDEPSKLFRSSVKVLELPHLILPKEEWVEIHFEKIEETIYFTLNLETAVQDGKVMQDFESESPTTGGEHSQKVKAPPVVGDYGSKDCVNLPSSTAVSRLNEKSVFSYKSHLPLTGTHVGVLFRDSHFAFENLSVFIGSLHLQVSCLAIPDAFLAHKDYAKALLEYRRIAHSFPGRQEAREGLFRAGITLLESGDTALALEEFEKLRHTPGAPLEYLGKALVYQALKDFEEEAKCYELCFHRYPKHPLLPVLEKEVLYRLHNIAQQDRNTTYRFLLLVLTCFPASVHEKETSKLLSLVQSQLEPLYFIQRTKIAELKELSLELAFWLDKPYMLLEILDLLKPGHLALKKNALFALIVQGQEELVLPRLPKAETPPFFYLRLAAVAKQKPLPDLIDTCLKNYSEEYPQDFERTLYFLLDAALFDYPELVLEISQSKFPALALSALLLLRRTEGAATLFQKLPPFLLKQETSLIHFLYGCFLYQTSHKETATQHFAHLLDTPYPKTYALASHYLFGKGLEPSLWLAGTLPYEKKQLFRQLTLFYFCQGNKTLFIHYKNKIALS